MTGKKLMILLVAAVFTLGVVGVSFSADEVAGIVSKIESNVVTVLDDTGKEVAVKVKNPESLANIKPGDRVQIKDGKVTKAGK